MATVYFSDLADEYRASSWQKLAQRPSCAGIDTSRKDETRREEREERNWTTKYTITRQQLSLQRS